MPAQELTDNNGILIEKVIKNYSGIFDKLTTDRVAMLRRDRVSRSVIYIGTGTCGIISGARATLEKVKKYVSEKNMNADIIEVGCNGYCSAEPLLDVQLPGKTRLSFQNVSCDKAEDILNSVLHHTLLPNHILVNINNQGLKNGPMSPA